LTTHTPKLLSIDPERTAIIEKFGGEITALDPIGAQISGIDLSSQDAPPPEVVKALEHEMAHRGFLVFKNETQLDAEDFLRASCLWGGRELHSTHGVHPETPGGNPHISAFRTMNATAFRMSGHNGTTMAVSCPPRFPIQGITSFGLPRMAVARIFRTKALPSRHSQRIARSAGAGCPR